MCMEPWGPQKNVHAIMWRPQHVWCFTSAHRQVTSGD
jgi:hypothetical protein